MQVSRSWGKNIFQNLKNRSFLEKIGLSECALKIGATPKKSEYLAAMQNPVLKAEKANSNINLMKYHSKVTYQCV